MQTRPGKREPGRHSSGDTQDDPLVGRVLENRYRVVEVLGAGGIGVVYRGEHIKLSRPVAIKVLHPEYGRSETERARFEREAHALAALSHPNVVTITDYGVAAGMPYLVMELLQGHTLRELLGEGLLAIERALEIARQVLRGLAYAHGQGLMHRDLKPENVFLQRLPDVADHVRILDFGLAKFVVGESGGDGPVLTRTGAVFGTAAYMAPEQASGDVADARADVYAAGVLLFELLAGRRPFVGDRGELLRQHLLVPPPSVEAICPQRRATPELEALLQRAMDKRRDGRFADAGAMLAALEALPEPPVHAGDGAPPAQSSSAPTGAAAPVTAPGSGGSMATGASSGATVVPRFALAAGLLGTVALVVLGAGGVALWWSLTDSEPPARSEASATESAPAPPQGTGTEPHPASAPEGLAPGEAGGAATLPDPWSEPVPERLANVRTRVERGQDVAKPVERALQGYAREHRDDPRASLLLGHAYMQRGWRKDAVRWYERAYEADPDARGDRAMRDNLVQLATHPSTASSAARALERFYADGAIEAVDRALAADDLGADARRRLQQLRDRLAR